MSCLNCGGPHDRVLSWTPCLFCGGLMNPCAARLSVAVTYSDGTTRAGTAHRLCTAAELRWEDLGLAPRTVEVVGVIREADA